MPEHDPAGARAPLRGDELRARLLELKTLRNLELEQECQARLELDRQRYIDKQDQERDEMAKVISHRAWHWFCTLTFRVDHERNSGGMHPEKALKSFKFWISLINRDLFGPNWHKRKHAQGGLCWVVGQEFHKSGRIHFHAVVAAPHLDLNQVARRLSWMDGWFKHFGIARIEQPLSQADVVSYVTKYVTKDGQIDFSDNYQRVTPPSLFTA